MSAAITPFAADVLRYDKSHHMLLANATCFSMAIGRVMLDRFGFRLNVGMVIVNHLGQVLWARRVRHNTWQFPQGGLKEDESEEEALYRELYEETGLNSKDVYVMQTSRKHYCYKVPKHMHVSKANKQYQGQKQRWFLLSLNDEDSDLTLRFNCSKHPEFDSWRWVSYWYPIRHVVPFKRDVYRQMLTEFAPAALRLSLKAPPRLQRR